MARVSVIIPTRDRRAALARALAGVAAQRFRDFEVIVIDDGSRDGTVAWLRENQPTVTIVEIERPLGAAAARNRGMKVARGEILAFLDDDDVWHPAYLATQVAQLDAHPEVDLSTTGHLEVDARGRVSRPDLRPLCEYRDWIIQLLAECPIHTLSVVACRRAVVERVGAFDESLAIVHDLEWYLRLAAAGSKRRHEDAELVRRAVPGGLVTRRRQWFLEERAVHRRVFAANARARPYRRQVRASRALFFARAGLSNGEVAFGLARMAEALLGSPIEAGRIAGLKLLRRQRHSVGEVGDGWAREAI